MRLFDRPQQPAYLFNPGLPSSRSQSTNGHPHISTGPAGEHPEGGPSAHALAQPSHREADLKSGSGATRPGLIRCGFGWAVLGFGPTVAAIARRESENALRKAVSCELLHPCGKGETRATTAGSFRVFNSWFERPQFKKKRLGKPEPFLPVRPRRDENLRLSNSYSQACWSS